MQQPCPVMSIVCHLTDTLTCLDSQLKPIAPLMQAIKVNTVSCHTHSPHFSIYTSIVFQLILTTK